jgi:hypothetical protein
MVRKRTGTFDYSISRIASHRRKYERFLHGLLIKITFGNYFRTITGGRPPLWSNGQSSWLQIQRSWVRFPALPYFLRNRDLERGSTQPREDN